MPDHKLVVSADGPEARLGLLQAGVLVEYFLERTRERGIAGNIYKGRISRVLPGMQADAAERFAEAVSKAAPALRVANA